MAQLNPKRGGSQVSRHHTFRDTYLFVTLWVSTLVMLGIIIVPVTLRMRSNPEPLPLGSAGGLGSREPTPPHLMAPGQLDIAVYPRVELASIIFRLAGNPEYNQSRVDAYARDVEEHFGAFRGHEAVRYAAALRNTRGIAFDAPMSMAIHMSDAPDFAPRMPFDPAPPTLDFRWTVEEANRFVELAAVFAKESSFAAFIQQHEPLYKETAQRLEEALSTRANLAWFSVFYGVPQGSSFALVPALLNGGNCYGASFREEKSEQLYCILGVWNTDEDGLPRFGEDVLPTVVHEFCHSYVNPLVEAHAEELQPAGEKLFASVERQMRRNSYGHWRLMMHESLVRASVLCYLQAYGSAEATRQTLAQDKESGFIWIEELTALLGLYDVNRGTYPDLDSFMPRLVEFFNRYAQERLQSPDANETAPLAPEPPGR